jgi:hypothetical protein
VEKALITVFAGDDVKLTLQMEGEADHEQLVLLWNLMVATDLRRSLTEGGLDDDAAWRHVEDATFGLAMLLDEAEMAVNGKVFRPRIAFVDEDGQVLDGAAEFDYAHEGAAVTKEDLAESEEFKIEYRSIEEDPAEDEEF